MPISKVYSENTMYQPKVLQDCQNQSSFANIYDRQRYQMLASHSPSYANRLSTPNAYTQSSSLEETGSDQIVQLGAIDTTKAPTVSHLLKQNLDTDENYWNIIFADINKDKQFNEIPEGAFVSVNLQTKEITWDNKSSSLSSSNNNIEIIKSYNSQSHEPHPENLSDDSIYLGTIDEQTPTVSNLLKHNDQFSDHTWDIVFATINKDKPYSSLRPGTTVAINPNTKELSFYYNSDPVKETYSNENIARMDTTHDKTPIPETAPTQPLLDASFSERLADSVKPYIGKPYSEIDCYQLVVRGIKSQGVQYNGRGGLRENMEQMARDHGLPDNAYLNGEGLVEIAGNRIFSKSYYKVNNSKLQAEQVFKEMKPNLQQGMILSFSTPSRGHTGIVSQKNGIWTFINSGMIDNQIDTGSSSRRVGEEILDAELQNWFDLAEDRNESLKISVGVLDENKLKNFNQEKDNLILSRARF